MQITRDTLLKTLSRALQSGGDFAEVFAEDSDSSTLRLVDGKVELASAARERGAGIRILKGHRSIYAYTSDTSQAALLDMAALAADALGAAGKAPDIQLIERLGRNAFPAELCPGAALSKKKLAAANEAYTAAKGFAPEISQVTISLSDSDQRVQIANSRGLYTTDRRIRARMSIQSVASDGAQNQTGMQSPGMAGGWELLDGLDIAALAAASAKSALTMLRAPLCPATSAPVVIGNGFGGVLFHEACGHMLESRWIARGSSPFCGKMGQQIASKCVTAIDDSTLPGLYGSANIDDEGFFAQRRVLIEDGILKGYLIDRLGALQMGAQSTASGRRQNYRYAPAARMSNTYIDRGELSPEQVMAGVPQGLYCKQMGGGSVDSTGAFNFSVQEGYWIKNGKIDRPVRGATLIGKGSEVLMRIDAVADDLAFSPGTCGSVSGGIPVTVGQPTLRVTEMTIGGSGRKEG